MNKLMIKLFLLQGLLFLKNKLLESLDVYKEIVSKDFDVSDESNSICQKRLKSYCKKYLFSLVCGDAVDTKKVDPEVNEIKKDIASHAFIKTFDAFTYENLCKMKVTALELFVKYRNQ